MIGFKQIKEAISILEGMYLFREIAKEGVCYVSEKNNGFWSWIFLWMFSNDPINLWVTFRLVSPINVRRIRENERNNKSQRKTSLDFALSFCVTEDAQATIAVSYSIIV